MRIYLVFIYFLAFAFLSACKSGDADVSLIPVRLEFKHQFAGEALKLYQSYETLLGDEVAFTKLQYYVSNIELVGEDGKVWKEENSYHLLNIEPDTESSVQILLDSVPLATYRSMAFSIGVDPARNHDGIQNGALDPLNGMFWTWDQGYIFFKAEGYHGPSEENDKGAWVYHIGRDETYRRLEFTLEPQHVVFSEANRANLGIIVETQRLFGGYEEAAIDLKEPSDGSSISVMGGAKAPQVADNYVQMFSLEANL